MRPTGPMDFDPFPEDVLDSSAGKPTPSDREFLSMVNRWTELTIAMNQVTRSMGEPDFHPFGLSRPAIRKLHFIHRVIHATTSPELARSDASQHIGQSGAFDNFDDQFLFKQVVGTRARLA